jgi:hypothetical protein
MLSSTVLVLAATIGAGQAEALGKDHLTPFDAIIGTWCFEGALPQDAPGTGSKGDTGTACISWKWLYDKNAIEWEWTTDFAGKRGGTKGLVMWDAENEQIVGHGVSSDGTNIHFHLTEKFDNRITLKVTAVSPDGKKAFTTEVFTLSDPNTLVYEIKDREGLPDFGPGQLRRLE